MGGGWEEEGTWEDQCQTPRVVCSSCILPGCKAAMVLLINARAQGLGEASATFGSESARPWARRRRRLGWPQWEEKSS